MEVPAWLAKWKITGTWESHIARGSKGGVDYAAPVGTPVYAPTAGVVDYRVLSDGSSVARVKRPDGTSTEFLHGIPWPGGKGAGPRAVAAGDRIQTSDGRKGVWGANGSTGPHIHVHDVNAAGTRVRPFSTITAGGGSASSNSEDDMQLIRIILDRANPGESEAAMLARPEYASTAIIHPVTGFVRTSVGRGPRDDLEAYTSIARSLGMQTPEFHVDYNGWVLSQYFKAPQPDAAAIAKAIGDAVKALDLGKTLDAATIAKIAAAVKFPTAEQVGAEVIRQQKLPGN